MRITGTAIQLTSERDFVILESKIAQINSHYFGWLVAEVTTLLNQWIVDPIQDSMRSAGVSREIIDTTYLDRRIESNGRIIIFHIKSDYVSESGFPVAKIIEYGRKAYTVRPKDDRPNPHLKWLRNGKPVFRKESKIPRKPPGRYIQDGIARGKPKVQAALVKSTKRWMRSIIKA